MISTRILDPDMGAVLKVPLTGRGTVHGVTIEIDKVSLAEFDVGLLELLSAEMAVTRFTDHVKQHIEDTSLQAKFIAEYRAFAQPYFKSPRGY